MEEKMYIKTYTNCSICLGRGIIENSSFRNTNVCPSCKGIGKKEFFLLLEDFKNILKDDKSQ